MVSIFLSHSSLDKPLARRIANDLKTAGHSVWLDEWEIYVGHSIVGRVQEGLEQCDFIAVLLTRNSTRSGWVEREWQSRIEREIQRRSVEILPLKADACEVPLLLRDKKWADFTNYETGFAEVMRALSHHSRKQSQPALQPDRTPRPRPQNERPESRGARATASWRSHERSEFRWGSEPPKSQTERRGFPLGFKAIVFLIALGAALYILLSLKSSWDTNSRQVPDERRQTLAEQMKDHEYGSSLMPRKITDLVTCWPTGCELSRSDLCWHDARFLRLGRTRATSEFAYDLQKCSVTDPGQLSYSACFSSPDEIFPLRPGTVVFANLEFSDGSRLPFQIPVTTETGTFDGKPHWAELEPVRISERDAAPFVAAKLNIGYSFQDGFDSANPPFDIYLGTGGCPLRTPRISKLLYDLDGHGLVEVGNIKVTDVFWDDGVTTQFGIPRKPAKSQIAIAFDGTSGKRLGPYWYQFDMARIFRAAAKEAGEPRLNCSREGHYCVAPGTSSPLAWIQVRKIEYGAAEDRLSGALSVSVSESYLLSEKTRVRSREDGIARFNIPAGWENVYYRLVLEDGKNTQVIRVQLQ